MVNSENKTKMLIKDTFFNKSQKKSQPDRSNFGWIFLAGFFYTNPVEEGSAEGNDCTAEGEIVDSEVRGPGFIGEEFLNRLE